MRRNRGAALLAVLWLSAALSAIAFSIATTVRGETERAATFADGVRTYYLASGALERALLYIQWGPGSMGPDGKPRFFKVGTPLLRYSFPSGEAIVEVIPESSKVDINHAPPETLFRLLVGLGETPERARDLVGSILDWRSPAPAGPTPFDQYYLSLSPSFPSRHASFQEIEELLLMRGMTTELFYGGYAHGTDERLVPRGGLRDCVSVFGGTDRFDANTSRPAVLLAAGLPPEVVARVVELRQTVPFLNPQQLQAVGPAGGRLRIGGDSIFTLRASARLRLPDGRLSDTIRSVEALVKMLDQGYDLPFHILRWYDNAWAQ
jgi:general secretion pathway protein K